MSSVQEKVSTLLDKVASLGICGEQAAAVRQAARDYDRASRARGAAVKNATGAGVAGVGSAAGGIACIVASGTGVGAVACFIGGLTGILGGSLGFDASMESVLLAEEEVQDAERALSKALDKLCACLPDGGGTP